MVSSPEPRKCERTMVPLSLALFGVKGGSTIAVAVDKDHTWPEILDQMLRAASVGTAEELEMVRAWLEAAPLDTEDMHRAFRELSSHFQAGRAYACRLYEAGPCQLELQVIGLPVRPLEITGGQA